jgi:exosortase
MATTEQIPIAPAAAVCSTSPSAADAALKTALRSIAVVSVAALFLYRHVLIALIGDWWKDPNYSHGFVMPFFAGFVIWRLRDRLKSLQLEPSWSGLGVCVVAMGLLVLGTLGAEFFTSRFSLLVLMASMVVLFLGWKHFRVLVFPWSMLLIAIPIPAILINQITFPLQLTASRLATGLLSTVGVPVLRDGNVIQLPSTTLEVVEACSGIRSLMSLIALAAIFGYLKDHRVWHRWLLVVLAVPIAVVANSVRIMGTGLLAQYWDPDKAEGFFHMFEGWVIFLLALSLLLLVDRVISRATSHHKEAA